MNTNAPVRIIVQPLVSGLVIAMTTTTGAGVHLHTAAYLHITPTMTDQTMTITTMEALECTDPEGDRLVHF